MHSVTMAYVPFAAHLCPPDNIHLNLLSLLSFFFFSLLSFSGSHYITLRVFLGLMFFFEDFMQVIVHSALSG